MRLLALFPVCALVLACSACRSSSKVGMEAEQRNQDLEVTHRIDRWHLTYSMDSKAAEDKRLEAQLSWRKGGGSRWRSIESAAVYPAPHARRSLTLPPEVQPEDVVEMVMVCRDEQGRETFRRRVWLIVPPEQHRQDVEPVIGGY